jgi:hypothetical protein
MCDYTRTEDGRPCACTRKFTVQDIIVGTFLTPALLRECATVKARELQRWAEFEITRGKHDAHTPKKKKKRYENVRVVAAHE